AAPAALWVLFALVVYLTLRPVIRRKLDNLATVRAQGVEMNFAAALLKAATAESQEADLEPAESAGPAESAETAEPQTTDSERRGGVSRLDHAAKFVAGRRILWVDDRYNRNVSLVTLLRSVGVSVDQAASTDEAAVMLRRTKYDVVITDGYRPEHGSKRADLAVIDAVRGNTHRPPVILFSSRRTIEKGTSSELFAFTSNSDTLIQYIVDVMERLWFGVPTRRPRPRTEPG